MNNLFRPEVLEHRRQRIEGSVVLRQSLTLRAAVTAVALVAAAIACWVLFGSYARVVDAPGILATSTPSAQIQVPTGGIVQALNVAEGSIVRPGQVLAVIAVDRQLASGGGSAGDSLKTIDARVRINDERVRLSGLELDAETVRLQKSEQAALAQARSLEQQIALQQQIVTSNGRMFDQLSPVLQKGFVSKDEYERRRQTYLTSKQTLAGLQQSLIDRNAEADQARASLAKARTEALTELASIESDRGALDEARAETESHVQYVITAPLGGQVTAVQTAPGRVADPAVPLMTILPASSRLVADVYAPTTAIGFVRPGQEVRVLYDAFPYAEFGSFPGRVLSISRDVLDPRRSELPIQLKVPVYKVLVEVPETRAAADRGIQLKPGMTLRASMILERRSFLDWLLAPIGSYTKRNS